MTKAYKEEIRALYALGCRNIQFDDPTFAFFCADSTIAGMNAAGVDWEKLLDTYIGVYNDILRERPSDLTVGLHTCRGNYKVGFCREHHGGACRVLACLGCCDVRVFITAKEGTTASPRNYSAPSMWIAITYVILLLHEAGAKLLSSWSTTRRGLVAWSP